MQAPGSEYDHRSGRKLSYAPVLKWTPIIVRVQGIHESASHDRNSKSRRPLPGVKCMHEAFERAEAAVKRGGGGGGREPLDWPIDLLARYVLMVY